jgi:hypothetical protein
MGLWRLASGKIDRWSTIAALIFPNHMIEKARGEAE